MKKRDHLPFSNCIFKIAESLPNAPQKPKLLIVLTYEYGNGIFWFFLKVFLFIACFGNILTFMRMISRDLIKEC